MCEYDTLNTMYMMRLTFWIVWSYHFWIPPSMSMTDVLMTLLILITRYKDDLDFILIENVAHLNYDLGFELLKQELSGLP